MIRLEEFKSFSIDDIRMSYKEYLTRTDILPSTVRTALSDSFYLWKNGDKKLFWDVVISNEFETRARSELQNILSGNTSKNIQSRVAGYLSHLRRFRQFIFGMEILPKIEKHKLTSIKSIEGVREIIINKMYVGGYLSEGENIGHEIINLYKDDEGNNYIYLNSQGTIDISHENNEVTVLLVRKFASKTYKVLAKAQGIKILDNAYSHINKEKRYQKQVDLGISYGGVKLVNLFDENSFRGSKQDEKNVYTTFLADRVIKPKNQIFITDDKQLISDSVFYISTNKGFGKQTLREFYNEKEKYDSFNDLNILIENTALWEEDNTTKCISKSLYYLKDLNFNFLKIIKQEDNEIIFSNLFAHFFTVNRKAFSIFARDILNVKLGEEFNLEREKKNIDLLISDEKNVIVIENKIKSGINGIDTRHDINDHLVQSQLKKYYHYVTSDKDYKDKDVRCFIFLPNYNRIDNSKYLLGDKYTIINYNRIYDFFSSNKELYDSSAYFEDFINALYKHTKDYDNDLEEEMQRRFHNAIFKVKKTIGGN